MKKIIIATSLYSALMIILGFMLSINMDLNLSTDVPFFEVFLKNLKTQTTTIVLSICTVGVYSLIYLSSNFVLLGLSFKTVANKFTFGHAFAYLLPHGIIEIPSMILTGAVSIFIVYSIIQSIVKKKFLNYKRIIIYLAVVYALIVIAAIVEVYLTPVVIEFLIE